MALTTNQTLLVVAGVGIAGFVAYRIYESSKKAPAPSLPSEKKTQIATPTPPPASAPTRDFARMSMARAPVLRAASEDPQERYAAQTAYDLLAHLIDMKAEAVGRTAYTGPVLSRFDGLNDELRAILADYQTVHGLPVTGYPDGSVTPPSGTLGEMADYAQRMDQANSQRSGYYNPVPPKIAPPDVMTQAELDQRLLA